LILSVYMDVKLCLSYWLSSFRPRLRTLENEQRGKLFETKMEGVCPEDRQNCKMRIFKICRQLIIYFFSVALPAHSGPRPLIQFRNHFSQTAGLLGRVISSSQGRYLNTKQHKHRINAQTDIYGLSGIRKHDTSVRASEDSSCLRLRGYCDRLIIYYGHQMRESVLTGNLAHIDDIRNAYSPKGWLYLGNRNKNGRVMLKWILMK
jgi:hypothetical protein